ncbi:RNA-binding domain-containing protein [Lipomyces oligophaga]|uniref:RNA-binding domain-containing protein n=1 Tax=Lipomyces oligophaga TaxID=45792 RepID=UPI0034CE5A89
MTDKLPHPLIDLFAARPSLRYLHPTDIAPGERSTSRISGVARYLETLNKPDPEYIVVETPAEKADKQKKLHNEQHLQRLQQGIKNWDPNQDVLVKGDPYQTLFVARLSYDTTEKDLDNEFGRFGRIERIRIVRDKKTAKPRGYAFIVFSREKDMKAAYSDLNGSQIKGRRILVDVERGRTVKTWKPRRLGGGAGGRHYTKASLLRAGRQDREFGGRGSRDFTGHGGDRFRSESRAYGSARGNRDWKHDKYRDRDTRDGRDNRRSDERRSDDHRERHSDRHDERRSGRDRDHGDDYDRYSKRARY